MKIENMKLGRGSYSFLVRIYERYEEMEFGLHPKIIHELIEKGLIIVDPLRMDIINEDRNVPILRNNTFIEYDEVKITFKGIWIMYLTKHKLI